MKYYVYFCLILLIGFHSTDFPLDRSFTIDADSVIGEFNHKIGSHGGPFLMNDTTSALPYYHELGISIIRTQDWYGPSDWNTIFPDWNADTELESSYCFATTDSLLEPLIENGFEILFRLGVSWGEPGSFNADPPGTIRDNNGNIIKDADSLDFIKFARICRHIVIHYNQGWANGRFWNIKRWEIWNEPSFEEQFWQGTYQQFRQMFNIVAKNLKSLDPSLIIGGPGQEGNSNADFIDSLLSYCRNQQTPIDFFSWHSYGSSFDTPEATPYLFIKKYHEYQDVLNRFGYSDTEQWVTEWNAELNVRNFANRGQGAAFYAATLNYFTALNIAESYQYRADNHPLGLVDDSARQLKTAAYILKAWKTMTLNTQRMLADGSDTLGNTITASKTLQGDTLYALISNYGDALNSALLTIRGRSALGSQRLIVKEISDKGKLSIIDSSTIDAADSLVSLQLIPWSALFIILYPLPVSTNLETMPAIQPEPIFLEIHPNPATYSVNITLGLKEAGQIRGDFYDMTGRQMNISFQGWYQQGIHQIPIPLYYLASGVYFCKMQTTKGPIIRKLTLIR